MFNLEEKLSDWRGSLPQELRENHELLEELESHLREAFERQMKAGKSDEDSWGAALSSIPPGPQRHIDRVRDGGLVGTR
jgi:hypothetical protein